MAIKGSRTKRMSVGKRQDARVVLRSELRAVTRLFDDFESSRSMRKRQAIAQEICRALTIQAQLEDEILYPALHEALDDSALIPPAKERQAVLKELIAELQDGEPEGDLAASMRMISEHIRTQRELLPKKRSAKLDTSELGVQLMSRKQELLAALSDFGGWD